MLGRIGSAALRSSRQKSCSRAPHAKMLRDRERFARSA
jgi:hypothetical protein